MKHIPMIILALASIITHAEIYEIIDESGNKTYTDTPPAGETGAKSIKMSPNPGNVQEKEPTQNINERYYRDKKLRREKQEKEQKDFMEKTEAIKEKQQQSVEDAEKALEQARQVKGGDYFRNNINGGGMRYTQEYLDRVKKAEADLERARKAASEEQP